MPSDQQDKPARVHDLLRPDVLAAFDRDTFEREGYWVWENVLTDAGRARFTAGLKKLQQINDRIVMDTDWVAIDYESYGVTRPSQKAMTTKSRADSCGGSEQNPLVNGELRRVSHVRGMHEMTAQGFETHGMFPEYFPPAYDDFLLDVTTEHPQMMQLLSSVLGDRFVLDHCVMLNRAPDRPGRTWHAHVYREGQHEVEDDVGTGRFVTKEFLTQQCVRNLAYPEGATIEDGGELAVIPGSHLYRIPFKATGNRTDYHDDMQAGWLVGKTHPFTGKPLEIRTLSVGPGTIISFVHHMPHYAGHRSADAETRWSILMAYRTPDPDAEPARWTKGVSAHWADRALATGKLSPAAVQIFQGENAARLD